MKYKVYVNTRESYLISIDTDSKCAAELIAMSMVEEHKKNSFDICFDLVSSEEEHDDQR